MSLRLPLAKFAAVLALVAAPAVGLATVATITSGADMTASSQLQGSAPSPSLGKDTTGWD
ncbi:hypothetical protein ABZ114_26510 [Streptomyces albidoflavus]|uniref:hypothetical protein n=1 Tax=Streptomyces TaxID=1883 RepID=UPI00063EB64C|nr:hypothetical protein [Streptomyces sp. KE1]KLI96689.1 hypothetical protein WQ59_27490 [Streptomyces sp. KE1]